MDRWAVFRQDFAGNEFLVRKNLTEEEANRLVAEFESHKHHQHYWAVEIPPDQNRLKMLFQESMAAGSSLQKAIDVLLNQGATQLECNAIVEAVKASASTPSAGEQPLP